MAIQCNDPVAASLTQCLDPVVRSDAFQRNAVTLPLQQSQPHVQGQVLVQQQWHSLGVKRDQRQSPLC